MIVFPLFQIPSPRNSFFFFLIWLLLGSRYITQYVPCDL